MSKQKKRSNILKIVLGAATALLLLEVVVLVWLQKRQDDLPEESETAAATTEIPEEIETLPEGTDTIPETSETEYQIPENTVPATVPATAVETVECVDGQINTPFFPLHYPDGLSDVLVVVKTAEEPFTLEFYAMLEDKPEQRIFDIRLSEKTPGNMGAVKTENADVYVHAIFYKFDPDESWTKDEINTVLAMQEAANEMIGQLEWKEDVTGEDNQPAAQETAPESSVVNTLLIETPYGALHYPVRWKDYLVTEQVEDTENGVYRVLFYGKVADREKCLLFAILFGGDEGEQLGVIQDNSGTYVTVNVLFAELDLDGWSEEDEQIISTMQEAVNDLIAQLPLQ